MAGATLRDARSGPSDVAQAVAAAEAAVDAKALPTTRHAVQREVLIDSKHYVSQLPGAIAGIVHGLPGP